MAAAARLSALAAVGCAVWLAASTPAAAEGSNVAALIGWVAVALLAAGLTFGYRGGISAAAVAFVLRIALLTVLEARVLPPLPFQALLIVLMIELGSASFTFRSRPADPVLVIGRALAAAALSGALVLVMATLVEGADASGVVVRAAGIAAVVVAAGWVTRAWRRSGLTG